MSVTGLAPGTAITFLFDGHQIASGTTDKRGKCEFEQKVKNGA